MRAGVYGTLVKPYARDVAAGVRPELYPEFQRRVGPGIGICGCRAARPNRAWTPLRNCGDVNACAGNLQIAAVIHRSTLEAESSGISGCEDVAPILATHSGVPGCTRVHRNINSPNYAAAEVLGGTGNSYLRTRSYRGSRRRRGNRRSGRNDVG